MGTMMSKLLLTLFCLITFLSGCCVTDKIAVVDPVKLFQDSEPGKVGMNHLRKIEDAMQSQIDLAQGVLENFPKNENVRVRFQNIFMEYQQTLNTEQQKVVEVMNSLIQKTLDEYRVKNGYNVIITKDSLLSYASSSDITNNVITMLNHTPITFEPVVLDMFDPETIVPKLPNK